MTFQLINTSSSEDGLNRDLLCAEMHFSAIEQGIFTLVSSNQKFVVPQ